MANTKFARPNSTDPVRNLVALPSLDKDLIELTVHAELLQRILSLQDRQSFLVHPQMLVDLSIKHLIIRERKEEIKTQLQDLL